MCVAVDAEGLLQTLQPTEYQTDPLGTAEVEIQDGGRQTGTQRLKRLSQLVGNKKLNFKGDINVFGVRLFNRNTEYVARRIRK